MAVPDSVIEVEDVEAAAARIAGHVRVTPVLRPGPGAVGSDLDLVLKLELFQHTGSFKPPGAFNPPGGPTPPPPATSPTRANTSNVCARDAIVRKRSPFPRAAQLR